MAKHRNHNKNSNALPAVLFLAFSQLLMILVSLAAFVLTKSVVYLRKMLIAVRSKSKENLPLLSQCDIWSELEDISYSDFAETYGWRLIWVPLLLFLIFDEMWARTYTLFHKTNSSYSSSSTINESTKIKDKEKPTISQLQGQTVNSIPNITQHLDLAAPVLPPDIPTESKEIHAPEDPQKSLNEISQKPLTAKSESPQPVESKKTTNIDKDNLSQTILEANDPAQQENIISSHSQTGSSNPEPLADNVAIEKKILFQNCSPNIENNYSTC